MLRRDVLTLDWNNRHLASRLGDVPDDHELRDGWRTTPHPRRLRADDPRRDEILERHDTAMAAGLPVYPDPTSGFMVFTADFLAGRGDCCDSGCRHCPWVT